jgi:hypothetical protein
LALAGAHENLIQPEEVGALARKGLKSKSLNLGRL